MTRSLFSQSIDHAFADAIGPRGAHRERFSYWRQSLTPALARLKATPCAEAAAIMNLAGREDDLAEIEAIATHIAEHFTALVVVGMGGSSISGETLATLRQQGGLALHFVDNIDAHSLALLSEALPWKSTAFLVISKSGNTVETQALMALLLHEAMARSLPIAKHFFVLTITNDNPLHRLATSHGMRVIAHAPALCGRFSILSAVGLIPAAAVGVDIRSLRGGAQIVLAENFSVGGGAAADAAALHMALMENAFPIHVLMHYSDRFVGLANWYRQCWSESLGKAGKGTLPVRSRGVTDQHSQLQLYLEGPKDKFFTALVHDSAGLGAPIRAADLGDTRLNYLEGHTLGDLAAAEQRATNATLIKAGSPLRSITMPTLDASVFGALIMHFTLEVMFTAELLGVNAFDQPAVESSKRLALDYLAGR